jgi:hypothetical protein
MSDEALLTIGGRRNAQARARKHIPEKRHGSPDDFQTPDYAVKPLLPYLCPLWRIWEPAQGEGNIVRFLCEQGYDVTGSDILTGSDFLHVIRDCDAIVTNPPYRFKNEFIARCYALGKPFALLMPLTALESKDRQNLYRRYGMELLLMDKRIHFKTPTGKTEESGLSNSWFSTCWFTWKLNLGSALTFAQIDAPMYQTELFDGEEED